MWFFDKKLKFLNFSRKNDNLILRLDEEISQKLTFEVIFTKISEFYDILFFTPGKVQKSWQ